MKLSFKSVLKYLFRGIAWGCTYFVFFCLFVYYRQGKEFLLMILENFPKHALGSMIVGIGYGSVSIVYVLERPSLLVKAGLHFLVGTGIFFGTAFRLAWIPIRSGLYLFAEFLVSCITFAVIWIGFYLFNRKEARTINEKLRELTRS